MSDEQQLLAGINQTTAQIEGIQDDIKHLKAELERLHEFLGRVGVDAQKAGEHVQEARAIADTADGIANAKSAPVYATDVRGDLVGAEAPRVQDCFSTAANEIAQAELKLSAKIVMLSLSLVSAESTLASQKAEYAKLGA